MRPPRIAAIDYLSKNRVIRSLDFLKKLSSDANPEVAAAAKKSMASMEGYLRVAELWGTLFRGLSLGSILLVAALGLAITFGLMGVINMAHGEIIVVGAYTTYLVQNIFGAGAFLPFFGLNLNIPGLHLGGALYESYFLFAIPISFVVAGYSRNRARARDHPVSLQPAARIALGDVGGVAWCFNSSSVSFLVLITSRFTRRAG